MLCCATDRLEELGMMEGQFEKGGGRHGMAMRWRGVTTVVVVWSWEQMISKETVRKQET